MDTIKLRSFESDKTEKLKEKLHEQLLSHAFKETKVSRYRGVSIAGVFREIKFSSHFVPRTQEHTGWAELEFHTWSIKSFTDFVDWIFLLVNMDIVLLEFITHEMKLNRIDLCIDIYAPKKFISANIYKVGAVVYERYRSKIETTYVGSGEEVFATYTKDKLTIQDSELMIPDILNIKDAGYSVQRLEHRLKGRKLPIKHIVDLPDLVNFEAFKALKVLVLNKEMLGTLPENKRIVLVDLLSNLGIHQVRKILNSNRNFSRTYGRCFDDCSEIIRDAWKQKITEYFN